jgi:XTP/dITP diphosphohydrolase
VLPPRLVLATTNPGKLRELRELLEPQRIEVRSLAEFIGGQAEETAPSYVENAILKARHASQVAGLPAIADDSGLEVDALGGAPGVHSARFAGPQAGDDQNRLKLLEALRTVPDPARTARYRCAMVYLRSPHDPVPVIAQASWEGRIAHAPVGSGGFGYDPVFLLEGSHRTVAEIEAADKQRLSHRGKALRALLERLMAGSGQTAS